MNFTFLDNLLIALLAGTITGMGVVLIFPRKQKPQPKPKKKKIHINIYI